MWLAMQPKGCKPDDVVHSRAGESDDFGRQEPSLAELR